MKRAIRKGLALLSLLALTGCGLTLGPVAERETIWAKMGTPGRIVDTREIDILVPDGKGAWKRTRTNAAGMVILDEPTLEYYRQLHEQTKGGAVQKKQAEF